MVQHSLVYLDYATTIRMSRQYGYLALEWGDNKANFFGRYALNAFLDNMVPILISYAPHYMPIEFMDKFRFLIKIDDFQGLEYQQKDKSCLVR